MNKEKYIERVRKIDEETTKKKKVVKEIERHLLDTAVILKESYYKQPLKLEEIVNTYNIFYDKEISEMKNIFMRSIFPTFKIKITIKPLLNKENEVRIKIFDKGLSEFKIFDEGSYKEKKSRFIEEDGFSDAIYAIDIRALKILNDYLSNNCFIDDLKALDEEMTEKKKIVRKIEKNIFEKIKILKKECFKNSLNFEEIIYNFENLRTDKPVNQELSNVSLQTIVTPVDNEDNEVEINLIVRYGCDKITSYSFSRGGFDDKIYIMNIESLKALSVLLERL